MKYLLTALALLCFGIGPAVADRHALLVGVSDYPHLDPSLSLEGPRADIPRLYNMLRQQGFDDDAIRVLADGVDASQGMPTLAAISDAIGAIIETVEDGDLVFLHFSGHGTQSPTDDLEREPDGLDELFLPRDVTDWNFDQKAVPNALFDHQVGEWLDALRGKGANVWVVFDSCHAGNMTRSIGDPDVRMRQIRPGDLGIPETRARSVEPADAIPSFMQADAAKGDLIAFFAAQSHETTPEMRLPLGDSEAEFVGLFTYSLVRMIGQNPNISYRQLAQMIMTEYNALPWRASTPLISGTNLDRKIFHREGDIPTRYTVQRGDGELTLGAGQLNGFDVDAVVRLYASPTAEQPIGRSVVTEASLISSKAPLPDEIENRSLWVALERPALQVSHRVRWAKSPPTPWEAATEAARENEFLGRTLDWVAPGEGADLLLYLDDKAKRLYFIGRDNQLSCDLLERLGLDSEPGCEAITENRLLSLGLDARSDEESAVQVLRNGLQRWVRAGNLLRTASTLSGAAEAGTGVEFEYQRHGEGPWQRYDPASALVLYEGDRVRLAVTNDSRNLMDISVLFVDAAHGITQLWPEPGQPGRLGPGQTARALPPTPVTTDTLGAEQLLILGNPTSRGGPPVSYAWLEQPPMEYATLRAPGTGRVASRGADPLFAEAIGDAPLTRGLGSLRRQPPRANARVLRWKTLPRQSGSDD